MKKIVLCAYAVAIILVLGVNNGVLSNDEVAKEKFLSEIKEKAKRIYSYIQENVSTLVIKSNIYNNQGELVAKAEKFVKFPDKMRINMKSFLDLKERYFIVNKNNVWPVNRKNKRRSVTSFVFLNLISALAGESQDIKILKDQTGQECKVEGKNGRIVTFY